MATKVVPAINGHRYSFASIECEIVPFDDSAASSYAYVGFTSINYSEKVQQVAIYGHDNIRIGRTIGPRTISADLQMLRYEWALLRNQIGSPLGRRKLLITISYADKDQPVQVDKVEGWLSEIESSNQEGTEASTVKLAFEPMSITWGGLALEEAGTDGTFWINDQDGIEGPDYAPNPWDTVTIGVSSRQAVRLPGVCKINGLPTLAFDKKKAAGVDGATITVNGYLPGPVDIECMIWTPSQYAILNQIAPALWRKPNKKQKASELARDVVHPALALWAVKQVIILGVSVLENGPLPGTKIVKIKCVEYVPVTAKSQTNTQRKRSNAPLDEALKAGTKNEAGDAPSKTDTGPGGPAVSKKGGTS